MERWDCNKNERVESPEIDAFIEEVIAVCQKHGFSISHEDCHGGFEIEKADERNFDWLREASIARAR